MRFSLIVPVYNVADYLQKCIDSILKNDCSDCEIILVDDGSTDGLSSEICDRNASAYPHLIRTIHQQNKGLGGARNTGIQQAKGEYLFFVDSDDTIAPNALAYLSEAIEKTPADVYSFPYCTHDGSEQYILHQTSVYADGSFSLREKPEFLIGLPTVAARIWRRQLLLDTGILFPDRVWYEDIRTSPKLFACADSIVTLQEPLYYYLQRPGSIMRNSNLERNKEIIDAFEDTLGWFRQQGLFDIYRQELSQLCVEHVLLAASVRVARIDPKSSLLRAFADYTEVNFPDYKANPYMQQIRKKHRLLLWLISRRWYRVVRWLFYLKDGQ